VVVGDDQVTWGTFCAKTFCPLQVQATVKHGNATLLEVPADCPSALVKDTAAVVGELTPEAEVVSVALVSDCWAEQTARPQAMANKTRQVRMMKGGWLCPAVAHECNAHDFRFGCQFSHHCRSVLHQCAGTISRHFQQRCITMLYRCLHL